MDDPYYQDDYDDLPDDQNIYNAEEDFEDELAEFTLPDDDNDTSVDL